MQRSRVIARIKEDILREIHALLDKQTHTLTQEHKLIDEEAAQYEERTARIKFLFDSLPTWSEGSA